MRYTPVLLAIAVAATLATPAATQEVAGFKVVIHADNPTGPMSRITVARMFLGKIKRWESGSPVVAVDQLAKSSVRQQFSRAVLHKSPAAILLYWQRQIFAAQAVPPAELAADADVLGFVGLEPGAIGYVSANTPIPKTVRVLDIVDLDYDAVDDDWDDQEADFDGGARTTNSAAKDETIGRHGVVHLFLTGSCGPEGEGRLAVFENNGPQQARSVDIETSVWHDGWLSSSSVRRHTVGPLEEKRLGCTHQSGGVERRYAILRASNVASQSLDHRQPRPARKMISIVDSGSCGKQRSGTWRSVINRHATRAIGISVQFREDFEAKLRRRYAMVYRLEPGATQRLGCSADGPITLQFTILEAHYR